MNAAFAASISINRASFIKRSHFWYCSGFMDAGLIGAVGYCQAFVFRYADEVQRAEAFGHAASRLRVSSKFTNFALQGNQFTMVGREKEHLAIHQTGRHIAIVIGHHQNPVASTSIQLLEKLNTKGDFHGSP